MADAHRQSWLAMPEGVGRRIALFVVALLFFAAGVGHFVAADFFVDIMPPYLPAHLELVYLSGVFEILGAVGVLLAPVRRLAGWGLLALLLAVYPANIHMAMNPELFPDVSPAALYARLPLQFVFAALVYWAALSDSNSPAADPHAPV